MTIQPVRQTVILAAGIGSRIDSRQRGTPKPLIPVAGRPLLGHALAQARAAGCTDAVVVVGSEAGRVAEYVDSWNGGMRTRVVHNRDYTQPNGNSLLAAEPWIDGRFYVQMADHLFQGPALQNLARAGAADPDGVFLLVDPAPRICDEEDATRVRTDPAGRVVDIGKGLEPWDAVDTGLFLLDGRAFAALRQVEDAASRSLSAGMRVLATRGELDSVPLREVTWIDVDTGTELAQARELFGESDRASSAGALVAAAAPAAARKSNA